MKMLHVGRLAATVALVAGCAPNAISQTPTPALSSEAAYDTALFGGMEWDNIGPNRGGRSIAVAGSVERPLEYYFGATGGGLWKTTDGGITWEPVTDGQIGSASVGALDVCVVNPDVVYIGTGEVQLRGNIQPGDGLYKSTDAGETWEHIGLREAHNFARVRVHPNDCNVVYAAAFGHYGEPNPERGVYRSTDGGESWEKILYRDEKTGAIDISIDPNNPDVIYAALWEAFRKPWGMSSGGPGSGIFKTTDGGDTWTEMTDNPGLPEGVLGKIGISVSGANPDRVWAIIEADSGGVFRSDDAGATWTKTNDERKLRQRAFYYTRIYADPIEEDRVYVLNTGFYRSDDAGETFDTSIRVPHGDNHDLWIAPDNNERMIESNDGGANVSINGGDTWTEQDYPTAQPYLVSTTSHEPYHVCGAQQDNSTICMPYEGWRHLSAAENFFYSVGGGESGWIAPDPQDPDVFYAGSYGGLLTRFDYATGQERAINIWPDNPMGYSAIDIDERFQWTFPIVFSKTDPNVIYSASQHVWRTTNEGQTWEQISPDLTRADPSTLGPSGGPITKDQTGVETYATIFSLAPSPHDGNVIWSGSDDGLVYVTRDGGANWTNVTPAEAPEFLKITTVEVSPHRPGSVYVVGNRFLLGDFAPYIYRTDDYGQSWTKITSGIPADEFARVVREDIVRPGLLYAGTEKGVWISFDNGDNWQPLQRNLPTVQVPDIVVEDHDLIIATHGRSFWALPNIDILRQLTPETAGQAAHLFAPAPAVRGVDGQVAVDYYLGEPAETVTLEFLDASGNVIRSFTGEAEPEEEEADEEEEEGGFRRGGNDGPSTDAGANRFSWDLRYPGYSEFPDMILWAARNAGPVAVPGDYTVRLTVDGETQSQPFQVLLDPRLDNVTQADLQARFDLALQIRDEVTRANDAVLLIRGIEQQVDSVRTQTDDAQIIAAADRLQAALDAVEQEIYQVRNRSGQDPLNYPIQLNNKIAALMRVVESAEARPTDQSYEVFADLSAQLDVQIASLNAALDSELAALNELLEGAGMDPVTRTPLEVDEDEMEGDFELAEEGEEEDKWW